jgi:SET domain-containing protein
LKSSSYLAPGLVDRASGPGKGRGTFARVSFRKGSLLAIFGGRVMTRAELDAAPQDNRTNSVQIGQEHYMVPDVVGLGDHINHSCAPNAGIAGQVILVALRDIRAGEEVCYDYAMTDTSDYDEFPCACGSALCRGFVTGNDWKLPELRERYRGYFSAYIERLHELAE